MQYPKALVISHDPVVAALLGASVELAQMEVRFPQRGETIRNALRRVRPALILADCDREDASADSFVGPALMTGARVAVFCSARHVTRERTRAIADRHGLAFFTLPDDAEALQGWVAAVAATPRAQDVRWGA